MTLIGPLLAVHLPVISRRGMGCDEGAPLEAPTASPLALSTGVCHLHSVSLHSTQALLVLLHS